MFTKKVFAGLVFFLLFWGCGDTIIINYEPPQYNSFSIPVWNYSDNFCFVDTLYKTSFLYVMNDSTGLQPISVTNNKIKTDLSSFQVWVQCDNTISSKKKAVAWILLPEMPSGGYDSATYKKTNDSTDTHFYGYFKELSSSEYYINPLAGFIGLKIDIPENYCIGVTYQTASGKKFGMGKNDVTTNGMMILKMIRCNNIDPTTTPRAWELKMKNIYRLPYQNISESNFKLYLKYHFCHNCYYDTIPGMSWPLLQMLKLDRYTGTTRSWKPDGNFDFFSGYTIIPETGDIIFPSLYPFRDELKKAGINDSLIFDELYSQRKFEAQNSNKATMYYIKGFSDTLK